MSNNQESAAEKESSSQKDGKRVARSAFKVSAGNFLGLIAGLLSQIIIAYLFGAGQDMDAFLTAMTIPIYLQTVLLASLSYVVIPVFVEQLASGEEEEAWALVGTIFRLLALVLIPLTLVLAIFSSSIIGLIAPNLSAEKGALAARMLSIMVLVVPITGFGVFSASVQNAQNHFFWPAARTALNSIGNVITLLVLYPYIDVLALAVGYVVAEAFEAAVTIVPVWRHGWKRTLPFRDAHVLEILRLAAPLVLIGVLTRITPIFERFFASGLPDGSLSYLGYTTKIGRIFQGIFGSTVATSIFPVMAQAYTREGMGGLVRNLKYGFRLTLALGLPALLLGSVIAVPLITLLFQRGAFTATTTLMVAQILPIVLLRTGLLFMLGNLLTRAFYVTKDTRTVPIISGVSVIIYIAMAGVLVQRWGYVGLAFAELIYSGSGVLILTVLLARKCNIIYPGKVLSYFVRYAIPGGSAALIAWLLLTLTALYPAVVQLVVASSAFGIVYMAMLFWLDAEIAGAILEVTGIAKFTRLRAIQRLLPQNKARAPRTEGIQ